MWEQFERTELLLGRERMERLAASRVAIFGVGGVGGYVTEALARSGVGAFLLVDNDTVSLSNLNRQIIATHRTIGRAKTEVMRERIWDINPEAQVEIRNCFYLPENAAEFDFSQFSYVVDAVDTVTAKIGIILQAQAAGVPVISSMGAGNKLDPTRFRVADLYETSVCPLARVMRRELKKRGVKQLKVVYSTEEPRKPLREAEESAGGAEKSFTGAEESAGNTNRSFAEAEKNAMEAPCGNAAERTAGAAGRRAVPGSAAFVPSAAGLVLAAEVVRDLAGGF